MKSIIFSPHSLSRTSSFKKEGEIVSVLYRPNKSIYRVQRKPLPTIGIAIPQERCYIFIQVMVFLHLPTHYCQLSDQLCSCKAKETRDHILLHCPRYHRERIKFFQALQLSPDNVTQPQAATITRTLGGDG
jgi:hypothetical protein